MTAASSLVLAPDARCTFKRPLRGPEKYSQGIVTEMTRKRNLTERIRNDLRYRTLLQLWLYFHVPLSFALLAALIAHVVVVFYYW